MLDKTQYFTILKQLHDVCRNNPHPSFTGMDAYNEIMNFLCLRHMTDNSVIESKYSLKTLYEEYCTDEQIDIDTKNDNYIKSKNKSGKEVIFNYKLLSKILLPRVINTTENTDIAFVKILGDTINNLKVSVGRLTNLFYKEPESEINDGGKKAQKLINKIYEKNFLPLDKNGKFNLNLFPFDGIGEGYEKFMKDAGQEGGNAGQYFTNIQVVNYILKQIKVNKTDKVLDPFAGSGGFILPIKKLGVKNENIYAREQDDKIYKFLKFNSMIAELSDENIMKGDSFDYHDSLEKYENYFDIIVSNPPYGMSIDINLEGDETKQKYWNVIKASKKNTIKDSMGLSLYSIIKTLKSGGTAGIVTERGVLNNGTETNSWQKKLRKYLLENTSVKEILLLPKGIFSYTNFDTAIIIFEKGKKTEKIVFNEGYFKDEEKGKSNKTMHVKENILTITLKDIVNKEWSLKYDDYKEKKENLHEGIEYKTLGEVCIMKCGNHSMQKSNFNINGEYLIIGGGIKPAGKHGSYNCDENTILCSTAGSAGYISIYNTKVFMTVSLSIIIKDEDIISKKYLFYYLKINQMQIYKLQTGQAQPVLSKDNLSKFKVPILSKEHQEEIVECIEKIFGNDYKEIDKMVSKLKDFDLFLPLLNKNYDDFEKIYDLYKDVCNLEKIYSERDEHKRALIKKCFKSVNGEEKMLGEVCKFEIGGTPDTKKTNYWLNGTHLWVSISDLNNDIIKDTIRKITDDGINNSNVKLIKEGTIMMSFKLTIGKLGIASKDMYCNEAISFFTNINTNKQYFWYFIKNMDFNKQKHLFNSQIGNSLNKKTIGKLKFLVPTPEDQQKVVNMIEQINKEDSEYNNTIKSIKLLIENIYVNIEMRCLSEKSATSEEKEISETTDDLDSEPKQKTLKKIIINGCKCIKENDKYYLYENKQKGELYAIKNIDGEIELVE
jgi:type I restriction-modification system DNA methylase subunit